MCTTVVRLDPGAAWPLLLGFVRDEDRDRDTLAPGPWWQEQPNVVGGRDARAGGTWLAVDLRPDDDAPARIAFVQNQIGGHVRFPPADDSPSRGRLPLVALASESFDLTELPGLDRYQPFHLVCIDPSDSGSADWWQWNGSSLDHIALQPGMHLVASRGPDLPDEPARRASLLASFAQADVPDPDPELDPSAAWGAWLDLLDGRQATPDDFGGLVVHSVAARPGFGTVGATLVAIAADGRVRYDVNETTTLTPDAWVQVQLTDAVAAAR